eukprot:scaffold2250_cov40-Prasinocladus_malaysianus.AAC.2
MRPAVDANTTIIIIHQKLHLLRHAGNTFQCCYVHQSGGAANAPIKLSVSNDPTLESKGE